MGYTSESTDGPHGQIGRGNQRQKKALQKVEWEQLKLVLFVQQLQSRWKHLHACKREARSSNLAVGSSQSWAIAQKAFIGVRATGIGAIGSAST